MRGSRAACGLVLGACLLLVGSMSPACAHDISEPGLCAAQCIFGEPAGHADAVMLHPPAPARFDPSRGALLPATEARAPDVVATGLQPRAPPTR